MVGRELSSIEQQVAEELDLFGGAAADGRRVPSFHSRVKMERQIGVGQINILIQMGLQGLCVVPPSGVTMWSCFHWSSPVVIRR